MSNLITAQELQKMLEPGIKVKSLEAMGEEFRKSAANKLFSEKPSERLYEEVLTTNTIPEFEKFTGRVTYNQVKEGHYAKFYNYEYVNGFQIQQKFIRTNLYKGIWPRAAYELGLSFARSVENLSMSVFDNANNVTVITLPDGQALASTAHPSSVDASFTQSNITTSALSRASLETLIINGSRWKTANREPLTTVFDTLVIPPNLKFTAQRINQTILGGTSGGANNDVNVQKGQWNIIVSPYLTDPNNYYVIDSGRMKMNLWRNWVAGRGGSEIGAAEDFDSFAAKWRAYFFMGLEVDQWEWVYCGIVA